MFTISTSYKKGIFWCFKQTGGGVFDEEDYYGVYRPIVVYCDANGNALEELLFSDKPGARVIHPAPPQYSSKHGDNFNHKLEWGKYGDKLPFNYYPRGRIEVKNGRIKIFASSTIVASEEYKEAVCRAFHYRPDRKDITWIADDSEHYSYVTEEWQGENNLVDAAGLRWWFDEE